MSYRTLWLKYKEVKKLPTDNMTLTMLERHSGKLDGLREAFDLIAPYWVKEVMANLPANLSEDFVNDVITMGIPIADDAPFSEVLEDVKEAVIRMYENKHCPVCNQPITSYECLNCLTNRINTI